MKQVLKINTSKVTGKDGKQYPPTKNRKPKPDPDPEPEQQDMDGIGAPAAMRHRGRHRADPADLQIHQ